MSGPTTAPEVKKADVEGKIGDIGAYSVDYTDDGMLDAKAGVEVSGVSFGIFARGNAKTFVLNWLKGYAARTKNTLDDKIVEFLSKKV